MHSSIRYAVLGALMVGGTTVAMAQGPKTVLGIMGGFNSATLSVDDPDGFDINRRSGFLAGAFLSFRVGDRISIEPQAYYSQQGAKASDAVDALTVKVDYITIPVLLGVSLGAPDAAVQPVIFAGPAISFRAKCALEFSSGTVSVEETCESDGEVVTKSTDIAGIAGARLDIRAGSGTFRIGARYTKGLSNLTDDQDSVKNKLWSILVGYGFAIGGK